MIAAAAAAAVVVGEADVVALAEDMAHNPPVQQEVNSLHPPRKQHKGFDKRLDSDLVPGLIPALRWHTIAVSSLLRLSG